MAIRLVTDFTGTYHVIDVLTNQTIKFSLTYDQALQFAKKIGARIV